MQRKLVILENRLSQLQKKAGLTNEEIDYMTLPEHFEKFQNELEFALKASFSNIQMFEKSFTITLPFFNSKVIAEYSYTISPKTIEHNMMSFENRGFLNIRANFFADGMFEEILEKKMPISVYWGVGYMRKKLKTNASEIVNKIKNDINTFLVIKHDLPSVQ